MVPTSREVVARRLVTLGGSLGFVLVCLASLAGYIRADEATKGYYTHWLRAIAAAGVAFVLTGCGGVTLPGFYRGGQAVAPPPQAPPPRSMPSAGWALVQHPRLPTEGRRGHQRCCASARSDLSPGTSLRCDPALVGS